MPESVNVVRNTFKLSNELDFEEHGIYDVFNR